MTAADCPSVTPRVGDTITTAEQLDALPVGSVMRTRGGALAETGDMRGKPSRVVWCEGWSEHADAIEYLAPFTVLYVPGEPSRPSVTDNARAEGGVIKVPEGEGERFGDALVADALRTHARAEAEKRWPRHDDDAAPYSRGAFIGFLRGTEWAAGRAETTTATDEDVFEQAIDVIRSERNKINNSSRAIARALRKRGLLATARTRPTREQIARALDHAGAFCGECGAEPGDFFDSCLECQRWLLNYADAVLALLADQPTETTKETPCK